MALALGSRLGGYEVVALLRAAGPASARGVLVWRERWRGLAAAHVVRTS